MLSHPDRSFWSVLSFVFFALVMLAAAFAAVHQAGALRDAAVDIQARVVPFSRGVMELESNLTALRGSDAVLRRQSENNDRDDAELLRVHNYMAQILEELVALSALSLSDVQHTALYTLQTNVTRYQRQHDEFSGLVSASKFAEALDYYDTVLAEQSADIASQVSGFMGLNQRLQQNNTAALIGAYTATYWTIVGGVGAALGASLLLVAGLLRRSTRRQRSPSLPVHTVLS